MSHIDDREITVITPRVNDDGSMKDAPPLCVFHAGPSAAGEPYAFLATFNRSLCSTCYARIASAFSK